MIRKPIVAGQFYPERENLLRQEVAGYIESEAKKTKALGTVVPHAGYVYSGETAGAVYSRIIIPDTVVILGPNHTGKGELFSIQVEGSWETPLGEVRVDSVLAKEILENSDFIVEDGAAHKYEHSIEVQIPFLQHLRNDIQVVPIVLSDCEIDVCKNIGEVIADAVSEKSPDTVIIASSDMTHYESAAQAKAKDEKAIQAILNLNAEDLINRVRKLHISMCGYIPATVMLVACKKRGAKKVEVVKYTNSGEKSGDLRQVVGYAGIIIS